MVYAKKDRSTSEIVEKLEQWCDRMENHVSDLRENVKAFKKKIEKTDNASMGSDAFTKLNVLEEKIEQISERQESFYKKERKLWETEKEEWRKLESELRNEIARLQTLLGNVSTSTTVAPQNMEVETKSEAVAFSKGSPTSAQEAIAAAMAAVDKVDVLSTDFDKWPPLSVNGTKKADSTNTNPETEASKVANMNLETGEPVETVKSPPSGPPPTLSIGDDDIYWVSQLQEALCQKGFYCGDDDVSDFYFGEGTLSALITFQTCQNLEETGMTDTTTWKNLLGNDLIPVIGDVPSNEELEGKGEEKEKDDTTNSVKSAEKMKEDSKKEERSRDFPVLAEFDGGRDVHHLQVMLEIAGYSCGKDDMVWWHYGDGTVAAMRTFQACNGLPESGVADKHSWQILAGNGKTMKDIAERVQKEDIFEEDLSNSDRVWLLGEQRWERKS